MRRIRRTSFYLRTARLIIEFIVLSFAVYLSVDRKFNLFQTTFERLIAITNWSHIWFAMNQTFVKSLLLFILFYLVLEVKCFPNYFVDDFDELEDSADSLGAETKKYLWKKKYYITPLTPYTPLPYPSPYLYKGFGKGLFKKGLLGAFGYPTLIGNFGHRSVTFGADTT